MKRATVAAVAVLGVVLLAGCSGRIDSVTNVTENAATINVTLSCSEGAVGEYWAEYRRSAAGGWTEAERRPFRCVSSEREQRQYQLTGLSPGTTYDVRLCYDPAPADVGALCADRNGTVNGTSYAGFTTEPATAARQRDDCMRDPSACGFPDVETTGPTVPESELQVVNGNVNLTTNGQVYQNRDVRGCVDVNASNVTLRNVKITCPQNRGAIGAFNAPGLVVEDSEIDFSQAFDGWALGTSNQRWTRVFFHGGVNQDCVTFGDNITIEDSLCSLGPDANDDGWADSTGFCNNPNHFDGFQGTFTPRNAVIRHNTIRNPCRQTSAIIVGHVTANTPVITVENNLMAGGGYTLYCEDLNQGVPMVVRDNRFSRVFFPNGGWAGPTTSCNKPWVTALGNVWDDTGAAL